MEDSPYFQVRWNKQGICTHVIHVLVPENQFEDLVEECFGEGQEEIFKEKQSLREASINAKTLGRFLKEKNIPCKVGVLFKGSY
ncbi:hypothetical protein [Enterococcus sp. BWR-S5]|uniref:hypothetical protein n=1 Tax=Enterococcus sp. BWR-S5 TaxID=2787714 RepID=UPI0019209B4E|nr:hypothetical protein [Enterococcus sp. BWR-S5]MBL1227274.1 hypothetical protein [Enterococcus sp. BWR-S5]